jgi:transcriptional regulator with XRE-family HTH domain
MATLKEFFMKSSDQLRQNIRDFREDKQLTQANMAEKLNMSETGYAKIERGESAIKYDRLVQIAQVLEVGIGELIPFGDEGSIIFNNSNDNFSNSSNFSLALGNAALEGEINSLHQIIEAKNEILDSREREIAALQQQISTLEKLVVALEK